MHTHQVSDYSLPLNCIEGSGSSAMAKLASANKYRTVTHQVCIWGVLGCRAVAAAGVYMGGVGAQGSGGSSAMAKLDSAKKYRTRCVYGGG